MDLARELKVVSPGKPACTTLSILVLAEISYKKAEASASAFSH
ncbi:hypothetical protein PsAD2_04241 [Pseudovibrio axinellae]|uniref:Uncharacterized protein n=1 Tax=Pseudovibrio axinellae TaxID=989403 RepID=A0A165TWM7_9HYPH|nr:hypothetical protein PsAD2_04241 [Pseudovibrio axinellae]SER62060.1 hypothetical protein SAMN05421798_11453 [Pseudovibrio axinellae]